MATKQTEKTTPQKSGTIAEAKGKLGIMLPGMGAVATTFVAGVEAVRKGISQPIGSLTQMGTIRLGKRTEGRSPKINDFVPLAQLNDLVFTGWDIFEDDISAIDKAPPCGLRSPLREEARWPQREKGQEQDGVGRTASRRHP